jgi:oligopeptide/dipeptide ABC transporter, ATP-binding protein, C-terminal domain
MAIACKPDILIADEPTTALDVTIQAQILRLLEDMKSELGMALIMITHDLGIVASIADRVIVMYGGTVIEEATVKELYKNPQHPYTSGLLECIPRINGTNEELYTIPGMVPNLGEMPNGCKFANRCKLAEQTCFTSVPAVKGKNQHSWSCHVI